MEKMIIQVDKSFERGVLNPLSLYLKMSGINTL